MEAFNGPRPPFAYKGSSSPHSAIQFKMSASLLWFPLLLAVISVNLASPTTKPFWLSGKQTFQDHPNIREENNISYEDLIEQYMDKDHVDIESAEEKNLHVQGTLSEPPALDRHFPNLDYRHQNRTDLICTMGCDNPFMYMAKHDLDNDFDLDLQQYMDKRRVDIESGETTW